MSDLKKTFIDIDEKGLCEFEKDIIDKTRKRGTMMGSLE